MGETVILDRATLRHDIDFRAHRNPAIARFATNECSELNVQFDGFTHCLVHAFLAAECNRNHGFVMPDTSKHHCEPAPTAALAAFTWYRCGVPSKMKMPSPRVPQ